MDLLLEPLPSCAIIFRRVGRQWAGKYTELWLNYACFHKACEWGCD